MELKIKKQFFGQAEWDIDKITRASSAAGPLATWAESILEYAKIMRQIDPMRQEVNALEAEQKKNEQILQENLDLVKELEGKIEQFKADYGILIGKVQEIKNQMEEFQKQC